MIPGNGKPLKGGIVECAGAHDAEEAAQLIIGKI
jgi:hypothetical protein